MSREGDSLRVAFCNAIDVETVLIDSAQRGWGLGGFVETVYLAKGDASLPAGFVLSTKEDVDGLTAELRLDPRLDEANEITVMANSSEGNVLAISFSFPSGTLPSERWLRSDGTIADEPC